MVAVPPNTRLPVTEVVPVTAKVKLFPVVKVVPEPTSKAPVIAKLATVVAEAVPVSVKLLILVIAATNVLVPLPDKVR